MLSPKASLAAASPRSAPTPNAPPPPSAPDPGAPCPSARLRNTGSRSLSSSVECSRRSNAAKGVSAPFGSAPSPPRRRCLPSLPGVGDDSTRANASANAARLASKFCAFESSKKCKSAVATRASSSSYSVTPSGDARRFARVASARASPREMAAAVAASDSVDAADALSPRDDAASACANVARAAESVCSASRAAAVEAPGPPTIPPNPPTIPNRLASPPFLSPPSAAAAEARAAAAVASARLASVSTRRRIPCLRSARALSTSFATSISTI